jgi:hypothetical protein
VSDITRFGLDTPYSRVRRFACSRGNYPEAQNIEQMFE